MPNQKEIHFFPGHMKKTLKNIEPMLKSVDMVVEIVDARAPSSTRNPLLNNLIGSKPRVIIMSKNDLADSAVSKAWEIYFEKQNYLVLSGSLKDEKILVPMRKKADPIFKVKRDKEAKIGMKPQPVRMMVIGVPNVGKSTFINNMVGKRKTIVGNKAGVTRGEQWVKVSEDFILLDTPGVLPMNYEDRNDAVNLALLGNIKEEILPTEELANILINYLRINYPNSLNKRFEIENISSFTNEEILIAIAKRRGLLEASLPSISKASYLILKEFKDGLLGSISLEKPNA